jgi:hypothetical protein
MSLTKAAKCSPCLWHSPGQGEALLAGLRSWRCGEKFNLGIRTTLWAPWDGDRILD